MTKYDKNRNLIGIDDLDAAAITAYLDKAQYYADALDSGDWNHNLLAGKIILNLFFEHSTRTLTSFEMAAKRLGAKVVNWNAMTSSLNKGETFSDTIDTLNAMRPDGVVIRHKDYGTPGYVASRMDCPVINGGDSWREHPTQALLDALTMRQHFGDIKGLTVAIIGDIAHSRVASSNMRLLQTLGANVHVIAPAVLMPEELAATNAKKFEDLEDGLKGCDIAMTIRPQKERMDDVLIDDVRYFREYGLTHEKFAAAKKGEIEMDPGPFLRGVQISDELADDDSKFIYAKQVANGIPTRMAVLDMLVGHSSSQKGS
jgi:aspartate carbamoyltransferase catalytic subunit